MVVWIYEWEKRDSTILDRRPDSLFSERGNFVDWWIGCEVKGSSVKGDVAVATDRVVVPRNKGLFEVWHQSERGGRNNQ